MFGHASRVSLRLDCGRKEVRDMNTYDAVILAGKRAAKRNDVKNTRRGLPGEDAR